MIASDDPTLEPSFRRLLTLISAQGARQWIEDKAVVPDPAGLTYLCKFAFFTGLVTKAEIARVLRLDRRELKELVRGWYDDHRAKGCGMC